MSTLYYFISKLCSFCIHEFKTCSLRITNTGLGVSECSIMHDHYCTDAGFVVKVCTACQSLALEYKMTTYCIFLPNYVVLHPDQCFFPYMSILKHIHRLISYCCNMWWYSELKLFCKI